MDEMKPEPVMATHIRPLPETAEWPSHTVEITTDETGRADRIRILGEAEVLRDLPGDKIQHITGRPDGAAFVLRFRPKEGFMREHLVTDVKLYRDTPGSNGTDDPIRAWNGRARVSLQD